MSELANQAVGDALSGVLLVEALLLIRDWSIEDWDSMYEDMPSRQLKVGLKLLFHQLSKIIERPTKTPNCNFFFSFLLVGEKGDFYRLRNLPEYFALDFFWSF